MRSFSLFFSGLLCCVLLLGCRTHTRVAVGASHPSGRPKASRPGYGPPPHAPAHGYRHKNRQGVELEFDSGLGVYAAVGLGGVFFHDGRYFRLSGSRWQMAGNHVGPWRAAAEFEIPSKLFKAKGKGGPPGKGKGKGPGKGRGKGQAKGKQKGKR